MLEEPLCRICQSKGFVTMSREVDHIVPRTQGGRSIRSNLQGICRECHHLKTQRESKTAQWKSK
jgi:5-methylcytosine-specific restriction protein A